MKPLSGIGWSNQAGAGYEVSSKGDKRFSALYARLPDGRLIEDAWGQAKGYADGRAAKGRPATRQDFDYWNEYKGLWSQWAQANPGLMDELAQASQGQALVDRFAKTDNNQARALAELLAERSPGASAASAQRTGPLRLIVAGGRDFTDADYLQRSIANALGEHPLNQLRIVSGGAKGADLLGEQWAGQNSVEVDRYPAKWDDITAPGAVVAVNRQGRQYNKLAGFQRNDVMAANADAVLVLPGGSGTEHMVQAAKAKGLTVFDARGSEMVRSGPPLPMPEQPAAAVNPTSQQAADAVQLDLWGKGRRFAGEAWPYLAAAGGAGALGLAVMQLQDGQESIRTAGP